MKKLYGMRTYVQSAGVRNDLDIDGFAVAVCKEIGVELSRHQARSFDEMHERGEELTGFDLVIALSPSSQREALELSRFSHTDVEFWPIIDPTGIGEGRESKLIAYRQARDMIRDRIIGRFGNPEAA